MAGDRDRGETNGRMFDFVSNMPEGDDWQIRVRDSSLWAAYGDGENVKELGTANLTQKETDKLWALVDEVEIQDRKKGKKDEDEGYVQLRLREPGEEDQHDIFEIYVSRADAGDDEEVRPPVRRTLERAAALLGLVGGAALLGVMATMMITVVGNAFGAPLLGDSEIVELLGGIAVFAFLPYCQLRGANVFVDFFTKPLPDRAKAWLDAAMNLVFAAVAVILTWRLIEGGIGVYERDKRSMFLQLPDWWAYGVGAVAMLLWIATCLLIAWEGVQRARGRLAPAQESPTGFA
jgi:TRAP-type C4-dicarboxylate transport system permease small subunit